MMTESPIRQAAFATGLVLHEGTGRPLAGVIEISAEEGPVVGKVCADGRFVVSAYIGFSLLHLRLRAYSAQYRAGSVEVVLPVQIPPGSDFDPEPPAVPTPLIDLGTVLLPADPVNIRGVVTDASNPETPVDGAQVEIFHGGPNPIAPAMTDAEGRFRFDEVMLKAPAQIQCSKANFQTELRLLLPDYGRLINDESFRLLPA